MKEYICSCGENDWKITVIKCVNEISEKSKGEFYDYNIDHVGRIVMECKHCGVIREVVSEVPVEIMVEKEMTDR